jgi:hypothetical protein
MWAVCVYLEALSVFPQLKMMQNAKVGEQAARAPAAGAAAVVAGTCSHAALSAARGGEAGPRPRHACGTPATRPRLPQIVERFTAHYVFALGLSRFFSCAHWILQVRAVGAELSPHLVSSHTCPGPGRGAAAASCASTAATTPLAISGPAQPATCSPHPPAWPRGTWLLQAGLRLRRHQPGHCALALPLLGLRLLTPPCPAPCPPPPQILEGNKYLWQALGSGLWPVLVLLSEVVQTFILADFWWAPAGAARLCPASWLAAGCCAPCPPARPLACPRAGTPQQAALAEGACAEVVPPCSSPHLLHPFPPPPQLLLPQVVRGGLWRGARARWDRLSSAAARGCTAGLRSLAVWGVRRGSLEGGDVGSMTMQVHLHTTHVVAFGRGST